MPKYRVYIIVSACVLLLTLFDDLNLDFNLKQHYPSWGTSAYLHRGASARRPHHSKCCIRPFLITWFTDPPTRFFRIWKGKKFTFLFYCLFLVLVFFTNVRLPVHIPDKGAGLASGAVQLKHPWQIKNYGVQYTMKGKSLSTQTQCIY